MYQIKEGDTQVSFSQKSNTTNNIRKFKIIRACSNLKPKRINSFQNRKIHLLFFEKYSDLDHSNQGEELLSLFRQTNKTIEHKAVRRQAMSDATAFMIASVLQNVQLTGGTPSNVACKTGTTNFDEYTMNKYNMPGDAIRDSWVIGFSTKTTIGMWYGYDDFTAESIAQGYVLHNVPATIQKDRLFNALVAAGAMESNRAAFKQPASVVSVNVAPGSNPAKLAAPGGPSITELFKKGTEPTEYDTSSYQIPAPGNFKVTENSDGKVTLSWSAVSPLNTGDNNNDHGKFGYNIYKDGVLITWTDKTSYTFSPSSPYGTYKVIATYKSYNDIQSSAAIYTLNEPVVIIEPEPVTEPENTTPESETNPEQSTP